MSIWVFVFTLAAIVAVVAFLKRGPAGPRNYVLKAETGVFEALDVALGLKPGTIEKSKPLVVARDAADTVVEKAIPVLTPIATIVPAAQTALTIAKVADQVLDATRPST